jgi:Ca2+/Na+ antiporter
VSERLDRVSLVAGVAVIAMGALLLLDQEDVIALTLGLVGAIVSATIGTILIVSGLGEEADER